MRLKHFFIALTLLIIGSLLGLTGSDLELANNWQVVNVSQHKLIGQYQGIRSDEWGVLTPLCLSQMQHKPAFPVVNTTIDVEGKNMLIVHDYGVPVKHISALARPSTWGYFTESIRFGMAWNWLFPLFIGFVGISLLFNLLLGVRKLNMLLAFGIVFAPVCAAWSNFNLYELGLGSVAAWSFIQILKNKNIKQSVGCAVICGWSATSFVLTLYLPRLVPMTWLYVLFCLAIILKEKLYKSIILKLPYILLAIGLCAIILVPWCLDSKEAINAILNSAYPGKRIVTGGGYTLFDFIRGWFPYQLVDRTAPFSNKSELSSFPNLSLFIVFLFIFYWNSFKGNKTVLFLFSGLLGLFYVYQYVGFPSWLAKITLLAKSHPPRIDSSVMVLQLLLISYFINNTDFNEASLKRRFLCSIVIFISYILFTAYILIEKTDPQIKIYLLNSHKKALLITILLLFICTGFFYHKNIHAFYLSLIIIFTLPGIVFNPITIAPNSINSQMPDYINEKLGTNSSRVLFLCNSPWEANTGYAIGLASLDGVHHYIDNTMYQNYYREQENSKQFNRFNHTSFEIDKNIETYQIDIPFGDCIRWTVNPCYFAFNQLPIDYVIAEIAYKDDLQQNQSLEFLEAKDRFVYYKVKQEATI